MQPHLNRRLHTLARTLHDPLSFAALPLATGITRAFLKLQGVVMEEARIWNVAAGWYYGSSQAATEHDMPILLVHGITANAITWGLQIDPLRRVGPVYALDLPGFGLSGYPPGRRYTTFVEQCEFLQEFIVRVIRRPVLVVGYSLGGWLAVRLAQNAPELVTGIVMMNAGGAWLDGPQSWTSFVETFHMRNLTVVRRVYRDMFGSFFVRGLLSLAQCSFQELFHRDPVQPFFGAVQKDDFLQADDLRSLTVPTGLIWGVDDRFLPAGSLEFFRDNLPPGAAIWLLSRCGHLPMWDRPWRVNACIKSFAHHSATRGTGAAGQTAR